MDKKILIRNFSRYAYLYDRYADTQKIAALKLLAEIKENSFNKILEIGCGTGNYTLLLREKFKSAALKVIDISEKMMEVALGKLKNAGIKFIIADAETIKLDEKFDLITSNACFQWFNNLTNALLKYKGLLNKGGIISFSVFGPLTFRELNASLIFVFKNVSVSADKFMPKEKIEEILKQNFTQVAIKEIIREESLPDLKSLLNKIKYTGIRGQGLNGKILFTPRIFKQLEAVYLDKFKQIKVTSQIFLCQAKR